MIEVGSATVPSTILHRDGITRNTVTTIGVSVASLPEGRKTLRIHALDADAAIVLAADEAAHVAHLLTIERKA